mmetsp:Transcript_34745/g.106746  ORF Transcript_34745/g.106746 Transcript_34745/m.106746 type:complete len:233 (-) Transcript_34745:153-851(-)
MGAPHENDQAADASTRNHHRLEGGTIESKPLRELLALKALQDKQSITSLQIEAERIPEVFIIGEVLLGQRFTNARFGLSCDWHFHWDGPWILLEGDPCGQTQTATAVDGNRAIWNHPLSAHFAVRSPLGWPKFVLNIQQIDEHGRAHPAGYGFCDIPMTAGISQVIVRCWRPTGSLRDEMTSFFMGTTAKLGNNDIVCSKTAWKSRCRLVTVPAGQVQINFNVVLRNFAQNP